MVIRTWSGASVRHGHVAACRSKWCHGTKSYEQILAEPDAKSYEKILAEPESKRLLSLELRHLFPLGSALLLVVLESPAELGPAGRECGRATP